MKKIATFDIETDPFKKGRYKLTPFCCDFYDGQYHRTFWGVNCIAKCVEHMLKFDGIIYAHNGGKFDFHFLLTHLPDKLKIFCINNRIASVKVGNTEFRDSYLILPTALSKFGNKFEIDYDKFEVEERENHKDEILIYLRQDNIALYNAVYNFTETFGQKLTLAATAFNVLEKQFKIFPIRHKNGEFDAKGRTFYYGGRVDAREIGEIKGENFYYIDINSAYPRAMVDSHMFGYPTFTHKNPHKLSKKLFKQSFFDIIAVSDGVLPMRKKDGGIYFPSEKEPLKFSATGWELESGMRRKKITVIEYLNVITPQETLSFKKFVEYYYGKKLQAKKEGDPERELFYKLILNSAYGKFAINPDKFCDYELVPIGEKPKKEGYQYLRDFEDASFSLFKKKSEKIKIYNNVYTAASITGWVRAFLSESLDQVDRPIYCDTDSIICGNIGNLQIGENLGEWKIEAILSNLFIGGKKIYAGETIDGKIKKACKGANLSIDEIKKVCQGETIKWESIAPNFTISGSTVEFTRRNIKITK